MSAKENSNKDPKGIAGSPRTTKSQVLETGASMIQDFTPVKQICAHLNAFHIYSSDPSRCIEANHYCTHLTEGMSRTEEADGKHLNLTISTRRSTMPHI